MGHGRTPAQLPGGPALLRDASGYLWVSLPVSSPASPPPPRPQDGLIPRRAVNVSFKWVEAAWSRAAGEAVRTARVPALRVPNAKCKSVLGSSFLYLSKCPQLVRGQCSQKQENLGFFCGVCLVVGFHPQAGGQASRLKGCPGSLWPVKACTEGLGALAMAEHSGLLPPATRLPWPPQGKLDPAWRRQEGGGETEENHLAPRHPADGSFGEQFSRAVGLS